MSKLILLMGVSGSGKTTVLNASGLLDRPDVEYVPSYTTREMRPGEVNGEKYHHITEGEFEQAIMREEFLEHALYSLNMYGTKTSSIMEVIEQGKHAIKEMEMNGFIKLEEKKNSLPFEYISIFLEIPKPTMVKRINMRGKLSAMALQERLQASVFEIKQAHERCDVVIDASQPLETVVENFITSVDKLIQ